MTSSPKAEAPSETDSVLPTYATIVGDKIGDEQDACSALNSALPIDSTSELCPYAMVGECRYGFKCVLLLRLLSQSCLHPSTPPNERHTKECVEQHEKDMELSFAVARSIDKICGICYEKVMAKNPPGEQRFGILPSCAHCYCLSCIRRWRQARQFDNKIIRACPECRVTSDCLPKPLLALSKKPCRYYRNGEGQCPFGNKCFYLHALPNGTVVDVGPPRRISGAQGRVRTTAQTLSIWEYIEEWEMQWLDIEDFMGMFDSDTTSEFSLPDMDDDLDGDDELFLDWDRM
ncbi:putative E3 ubiquitin-protein ligase makorin-1 [Orchesella cincta]|uniref:RING-type E3 ubiquitin transferase n=1 Tax=Orchesella cincta TaxID=48709 RepID=A0A1D2MI96_ORCCI|nr:putative E3 ubiquitin-protein ligase makorin-1 [Orchesella cincta]